MTTSDITFNGMTVEQGFEHVMAQLEPADIEYAIQTEHEDITPFGIFVDIHDHNMLFPFADGRAFDEDGYLLKEWTDFANAVAEQFNRHIHELRKVGEG